MFKLLINITRNNIKQTNKCFNRFKSVYEPDYLESLKPKYPIYQTLNFQIKGFDYPVIENYQSFVHTVADSLELNVTDNWAVPPKHIQIQRFKPASNNVESEYKLIEYERTVQISDMLAPVYGIFLRVIQAALPEGVTINVVEHSDNHDEVRYVPDQSLKELKQQLEVMGDGKTRK